MSAELSVSEVELLRLHEDAIEASKADVVANLMAIRDQRLYRPATFEDYCRTRWNLSRQHVNRMIAEQAVIKEMEQICSNINNGQAAELAKVPQDRRVEVWEEAVARTSGKPTAKAIAAIVRRVRQTGEAPPLTPGPTGLQDPVLSQDGPLDPNPYDCVYPGAGNNQRVNAFADDLAERSRDIRESRGADYTVIPIQHEPQFQLDDPGDLNRDAVAFAETINRLRENALDHARQMIADDPPYAEALYWALGTALTEARISNA